MYKKTILNNGLRIITVPQKESKTATVLVLVGTGSKYETKEISGISHFLEHMFFKGTKRFKKPKDVAEFLDKIGGDFNAFTGEEYTGYYAKVSAEHLDIAFEWVSDIFLNSIIPLKEVEKERGVIIEEINMYKNNPMMYIGQLWKEVLYGDQPAGWDIAGTKETVSSITRKNILNYISSQYNAKNTIVCLAGNINEEEAIQKTKKYFNKTKIKKSKEKVKVIERQKEPQALFFYKDTEQTNLALGVRSYNMTHKDKYVCDLLAIILGGMMSSRLFEEIREKLGVAYYVKTYNEADTDTGSIVTFVGVDNLKLEKVIKTILKEYKRLTEKRVNEKELKKAKDYMKGKMILNLESSHSKAYFYATQELLKKEILTIEDIFDKIDKVTGEDILRVAKDIFKNKNLNLALIGPNKKQYNNLLKL
ncbi:MAG: pitrilysin family protein [Candidatus Pacebacteria bacterium]|nr:pitrilysin family protein [Candidatus Paceibacterota bacterium]